MALDPRLPTAAQLQSFLDQAEIPSPDGAWPVEDLESGILAAYELAQELTGWEPLLSEERTITIFPPAPAGSRPGEWPYTPGMPVRLPAPLLAATSLTSNGAPVLASGYALAGRAGLDGPATLLRLYVRPHGLLMLTGTIGRYAELPKALAAALKRLAGATFLSMRREGLLSEGLASWDDGGVKETRGYEMTISIGEGWQSEAETTLQRFARVQF